MKENNEHEMITQIVVWFPRCWQKGSCKKKCQGPGWSDSTMDREIALHADDLSINGTPYDPELFQE